jgi:hypothetical protein
MFDLNPYISKFQVRLNKLRELKLEGFKPSFHKMDPVLLYVGYYEWLRNKFRTKLVDI